MTTVRRQIPSTPLRFGRDDKGKKKEEEPGGFSRDWAENLSLTGLRHV
jgi:hypothetical protein